MFKHPYFQKLWQFIKFGIVGASNTLICLVIYYLGLYLGLYYIVADALGQLLSTINAYYWNNRYVFNDGRTKTLRQHFLSWLKTLVAYGGAYVLNLVLLIVLVEVLQVPQTIAPLLNLLVTSPINFLVHKYWVFRKKK